jgi:serine/threonine protein kinase
MEAGPSSSSSKSDAGPSSSCVSKPFVEGWEFMQTLGEGAYGEVKLAVHKETKECIAVKIVHLDNENGLTQECLKKEVINDVDVNPYNGIISDLHNEDVEASACGEVVWGQGL